MLTQDAFLEHKAEYTVYRKTAILDQYHNETNTYTAGGTITTMFTPITDEASIEMYGQEVKRMLQAAIYDETVFEELDQVEINQNRYEIVSISTYPSYRLIKVRLI